MSAAERDARPVWVTNLTRLGEPAGEIAGARCVHAGGSGLRLGWRLFAASAKAAAVIVYMPGRELWVLAALRALTPWRRRAPLVVVDVVFTPPERTFSGSLRRLAHSALWRSIDLFLLHQKDIEPICRAYGANPARFAYIPFKVNTLERARNTPARDAGFIFSGGKSRRDFRTFSLAMRELPHQAKLAVPPLDELQRHQSPFDPALVPPNVEVLHDVPDAGWFELLSTASVVVTPITKDSISPSGVSVYLLAMALGKPVIITEGCATRGILFDREQAMVVPPEDPAALAAAIRELATDSQLREHVRRTGRDYALSLGGEETLLRNIVTEVAARFAARR